MDSDELLAIVKRKVFLAAANGVVPVSWEDMRAIESELQQRRAEGEWRSMDSAPRDRAILVYSPVHGIVEAAWECVEGGGHPENGPPIYWWTSPHCEFIDGPYDAPTHWRETFDAPPQPSPEGV
jgi:hypothetical protein